jgi:hypothetical protein
MSAALTASSIVVLNAVDFGFSIVTETIGMSIDLFVTAFFLCLGAPMCYPLLQW